jgi:hypothetical protein
VTAVAAWCTLAAFAQKARAQPQTFVALEYESAPDSRCPDVEEFESSVRRQLGYDPFRSTADRRVAVRIARKETGMRASIKWTDARGDWVGDRRLSSRRAECGEIAANTAFAVAVQIQLLATLAPAAPDASQLPSQDVTAPPTTRAPDPSATPSPQLDTAAQPPVPQRAVERRARLRVFAGLGPSLALAIAPKPTALGRMFVTGRLDRLSLELAVDAALPAKQGETDGSGFSLDRFATGAAACGHIHALAACLTATLGVLRARGFGVDRTAAPAGFFSQVGGRIAATRDFGDRYFIGGRVDVLVMLSTWAVALNDSVVWTTPRIGGLVGADFGVHFF